MKHYLKKYSALLNPGGSIVCDNINFHNLKIETVKNRYKRVT